MMPLLVMAAAAILAAVASASTIHLTPTATSATRLYIVSPPSLRREYQTQDSKGFYSYGYSDDSAAKAEYTARDGSSRGFYSYVDTNGKLQVVKYEAGRKQGFKALATNLPKAPIDNRKPPQPVQDTPEVALARQEHLDAIREAEIREELADNEGTRASEEEERLGLIAQVIPLQDENRQVLSSTLKERQEISSELLARVRAELMAALAIQNDDSESNESEDKSDDDRSDEQSSAIDDGSEGNLLSLNSQRGRDAPLTTTLMTTYTLKNKNSNLEDPLSQLKTIYTLADDTSNSYLKLGNLAERKSLTLLDSTLSSNTATRDSLSSAELRVPVNSYYTLVSPTILSTVPSLESLRLASNHLPISLSSRILTQRLNGGKSN